MDRLKSPLLIIGAGRSGSSLLQAILNAHSQLRMLGEMQFAILRLWEGFWKLPAAAAHPLFHTIEQRDRSETEIVAQAQVLQRQEQERVAGLLREAVGQYYDVARQAQRYWGFKEIWMGAPEGNDWEPYDRLFPNATYVHLVRNPFAFARSVCDWQRIPFTASNLESNLRTWVENWDANQKRQETGRYCMLKYEELIADPRRALTPLLDRLGLSWEENCRTPQSRPHVKSALQSPYPVNLNKIATRVPRLLDLMANFGYEVPRSSPPIAEPARITNGKLFQYLWQKWRARTPKMRANVAENAGQSGVTQIGETAWRLNPPFAADGDHGWLADLGSTALSPQSPQPDNLEHPWRSNLVLLEDGKPLGPGHCLHDQIREVGRGRFSHWWHGPVLLFSTSDNTDPNCNGRVYTVAVSEPGHRPNREHSLFPSRARRVLPK